MRGISCAIGCMTDAGGLVVPPLVPKILLRIIEVRCCRVDEMVWEWMTKDH